MRSSVTDGGGTTLNVSLTPQLEKLVRKKVASGLYNSASEVVREALRLLDEKDRLRALRLKQLKGQAALGLDQLDQGRFDEYDETSLGDFFEDVNKRGRSRAKRRTKAA